MEDARTCERDRNHSACRAFDAMSNTNVAIILRAKLAEAPHRCDVKNLRLACRAACGMIDSSITRLNLTRCSWTSKTVRSLRNRMHERFPACTDMLWDSRGGFKRERLVELARSNPNVLRRLSRFDVRCRASNGLVEVMTAMSSAHMPGLRCVVVDNAQTFSMIFACAWPEAIQVNPSAFVGGANRIALSPLGRVHLRSLYIKEWMNPVALTALRNCLLNLYVRFDDAEFNPFEQPSVPGGLTLMMQDGHDLCDAIGALRGLSELTMECPSHTVFSIPASWSNLTNLQELSLMASHVTDEDRILALTNLRSLKVLGTSLLSRADSLDRFVWLTSLHIRVASPHALLERNSGLSKSTNLRCLTVEGCVNIPDQFIPVTGCLKALAIGFWSGSIHMVCSRLMACLVRPAVGAEIRTLCLSCTTLPPAFFDALRAAAGTLRTLSLTDVGLTHAAPVLVGPIDMVSMTQLTLRCSLQGYATTDAIICCMSLPLAEARVDVECNMSAVCYRHVADGFVTPSIKIQKVVVDDGHIGMRMRDGRELVHSVLEDARVNCVDMSRVTDNGVFLAAEVIGDRADTLYLCCDLQQRHGVAFYPDLSDDILHMVANTCSNLRNLSMATSRLSGFSESCLREVTQRLAGLTRLVLPTMQGITDACLSGLAAKCPLLEVLFLSGMHSVTRQGYDRLCGLDRLRSLGMMSAVRLQAEGVSRILERSTGLCTLLLSRGDILSWEGMAHPAAQRERTREWTRTGVELFVLQ